jgi:hypothetical protein
MGELIARSIQSSGITARSGRFRTASKYAVVFTLLSYKREPWFPSHGLTLTLTGRDERTRARGSVERAYRQRADDLVPRRGAATGTGSMGTTVGMSFAL